MTNATPNPPDHGAEFVPLVQDATKAAADLAAKGEKDGAVMIAKLCNAVAKLAGTADGLQAVTRVLKHRLKEADADETETQGPTQ